MKLKAFIKAYDRDLLQVYYFHNHAMQVLYYGNKTGIAKELRKRKLIKYMKSKVVKFWLDFNGVLLVEVKMLNGYSKC